MPMDETARDELRAVQSLIALSATWFKRPFAALVVWLLCVIGAGARCRADDGCPAEDGVIPRALVENASLLMLVELSL